MRSLVDLYIPTNSKKNVLWSVNLLSDLRKLREQTWRQYKCSRKRFGRQDVCSTDALAQFNRVNVQYRNYVLFSRSAYEESLMVIYADEPKLFHAYICNKKKDRMAVGPIRLPCGQLVDDSRHG